MTDITDEQRAAYIALNARLAPSGHSIADGHWLALRDLLPSELTNPQPALPTEPGWYIGYNHEASREIVVCLNAGGRWWYGHDVTLNELERFAPFTRLVPERPQITADDVRHITGRGLLAPSEMGQLLALVNGTDRD